MPLHHRYKFGFFTDAVESRIQIDPVNRNLTGWIELLFENIDGITGHLRHGKNPRQFLAHGKRVLTGTPDLQAVVVGPQ